METISRWLIVRTEPRHELIVYSNVLTLATDAWLPREPRFSRPQSRFERQWWAPVLPGRFFVAMPLSVICELEKWPLNSLCKILFLRDVARDSEGNPIIVPSNMILSFRDRLNRENAQLMRLAGDRHIRHHVQKTDHIKRVPSRRLRSKVAEEIRADTTARLTQACATLNLVA